MARGLLVVFEGLDQSGKQTQAEALRDWLVSAGRAVRLLSFPTYETHLGAEIGRALHGERDYGPDVMQLLYVANRFEWKPEIERELAAGTVLVCDRYLASSVAYGEAQGLDARMAVGDSGLPAAARSHGAPRHRRPTCRWRASAPVATSTSAISRCSAACATATSGRRRRRVAAPRRRPRPRRGGG